VVRADQADRGPERKYVDPAKTVTEDVDLAPRRVRVRRHDLQQGALPRPVGPEQRPVLAGPDRDAHLVQQQLAVAYQVDAGGPQHDVGVKSFLVS
jgi:hypothetical protein